MKAEITAWPCYFSRDFKKNEIFKIGFRLGPGDSISKFRVSKEDHFRALDAHLPRKKVRFEYDSELGCGRVLEVLS